MPLERSSVRDIVYICYCIDTFRAVDTGQIVWKFIQWRVNSQCLTPGNDE